MIINSSKKLTFAKSLKRLLIKLKAIFTKLNSELTITFKYAVVKLFMADEAQQRKDARYIIPYDQQQKELKSYIFVNDTWLEGNIINMSAGGISLKIQYISASAAEMKAIFEIGNDLLIKFDFIEKAHTIENKSIIRWFSQVKAQSGFFYYLGLQFRKESDNSLTYLNNFLENGNFRKMK